MCLPATSPHLPIPHTDIPPLSSSTPFPLTMQAMHLYAIQLPLDHRPSDSTSQPRRTSALASFLLALFALRCSHSHTPTLPSRDSHPLLLLLPISSPQRRVRTFCSVLHRKKRDSETSYPPPTYYSHSCFRVERPAVERYLCTSIIIAFCRRYGLRRTFRPPD